MSSVNNVGTNSPVYTVNRPGPRPQSASLAPSTLPGRGPDTVEFSSAAIAAQGLQTLRAGGDIRADKAADIKAQIAAGTYDQDDAKIDAAVDKLLDDVL